MAKLHRLQHCTSRLTIGETPTCTDFRHGFTYYSAWLLPRPMGCEMPVPRRIPDINFDLPGRKSGVVEAVIGGQNKGCYYQAVEASTDFITPRAPLRIFRHYELGDSYSSEMQEMQEKIMRESAGKCWRNAGRNDQAIFLNLITILASVCSAECHLRMPPECPPNAPGNALSGKQTCNPQPSKDKAPA